MTLYKFGVGFVLAIAMVTVLALSALVFSARDFQFGVQLVAPTTNGLVNFERLDTAVEQIQRRQQETSGPRGELVEIEAALEALDGRANSATAAANARRAEIVGGIAGIETRASVQVADSAASDTSAQALSQRVGALANIAGLSAAEQQTLAGLNSQVQQLAQMEEAIDVDAAERSALVARQDAVGSEVAESNRLIYALQQEAVGDYRHFARIQGEVAALQTMSPWGVSAFLAQGHPALLSTILVLLMGALGSLLYLFPAYLNRPAPVTMAEIVVRLIFGMCAALAFYVLANAAIAGFSIASNVTQATTSSALNPFTVSLVGIVAGVLSEDIAKWIQDRGRGIFTQGQISTGATQAQQTATQPHVEGGLVNNQAIS